MQDAVLQQFHLRVYGAFFICLTAIDMKSPKAGEVYQGQPRTGKADCTITIADENFMSLVTGKLAPQQVKILFLFVWCPLYFGSLLRTTKFKGIS